jgi:hypothetical protein
MANVLRVFVVGARSISVLAVAGFFFKKLVSCWQDGNKSRPYGGRMLQTPNYQWFARDSFFYHNSADNLGCTQSDGSPIS